MFQILIVDDEPAYLQKMFEVLNQAQQNTYEILRSLDAKTALKILEVSSPDLIITDWDMPGIDGIEMIKTIKKNPAWNEVPIIMCTGAMTGSNNLKIALDAGAIDYIKKPIDETELLARVNSAIHLREFYKKVKQHELSILEQRKKEVEIRLEKKHKELLSNALLFSRYEAKLHFFLDQLKSLQNDKNADEIKQKILQIISSIENEEKLTFWNEFQHHFGQVHKKFYKNLTNSYPNLTNNEIKLCTYLRLKMTTKEIAQVTGQTNRAIEVARYRLRNKLDLQKDENLFSLLCKF